ncbi:MULTISPECIES: DUF2997 domain-containing protein [unclassified Nocardia]|uniref:DUF2997 domain-containing protein n=1 Tax=unclassified Nocardia TaxID=2637762 RepID=UPI001CE3B975|nr:MULTISPECIES: DUF2997 domain-containing protein [unclassified Nocardia]
MNDAERITVVVGPDGGVHAETHNIVGEKCLNCLAILEDLLDSTDTELDLTGDWPNFPMPDGIRHNRE